MNAPTTATNLGPTFEYLPLKALVPSSSPVQALRRQSFTEASLDQLGATFGDGRGVIEPLIVRRRPEDPPDADTGVYEIIAGERRYLAAERVGLDTVPCIIRDLDDTHALELQMVENLQRNAYSALEEAAGFRELLRLKSTPGHAYTPQDLGGELGKSRSYVYARLKLLDLCPEGQKALQADQIDASKALLLARFRSQKLQAKALEILLQKSYLSYRRVVEDLRDKFMQDLTQAPFDLGDEDLLGHPTRAKAEQRAEAIPIACTNCLHNSAYDPELQADLEPGAHVCTHVPCYEVKVIAFNARRVGQARMAGRTVLNGEEAKQLIPRARWGNGLDGYDAQHLDLDAVCDFPEEEPEYTDDDDAVYQKACDAWDARKAAWGHRTYREILGEAAPTGVVLDLGKDGAHEIVPVKEAAKLLKAKGIEIDTDIEPRQAAQSAKPRDPEAEKRAQEKEELRRRIELEYRAGLYKAIVVKWKPPFKRFELEQLYAIVRNYNHIDDELLAAAFGGKLPDPKKASEADLVRLIFALMFSRGEIEDDYRKPGHLLDYAGRLKIDPKKVRAEAAKALTPKSEPAPAKTGKVAKK